MKLPCLGRPRAALVAAVVLALGCRVPRRVHEAREYPPIKIESQEVYAVLVDARVSASDPTTRQLPLPEDFEARVSQRLASLASGSGPALGVVIGVAAADEIEIIDSRGEMTRVRVRFDLEFKLKDGRVVRRAQTESLSDLPRDEATPEEVAFVLDSTANDAFDRYFSDAALLTSLNRELAAQH
jgi:hypothetical protein